MGQRGGLFEFWWILPSWILEWRLYWFPLYAVPKKAKIRRHAIYGLEEKVCQLQFIPSELEQMKVSIELVFFWWCCRTRYNIIENFPAVSIWGRILNGISARKIRWSKYRSEFLKNIRRKGVVTLIRVIHLDVSKTTNNGRRRSSWFEQGTIPAWILKFSPVATTLQWIVHCF